MNKQRPANVLLDNVSSLGPLGCRVINNFDDIIFCLCHLDSLTAVRVLSRLDNPVLTNAFIELLESLPFLVFITRLVNVKSDR